MTTLPKATDNLLGRRVALGSMFGLAAAGVASTTSATPSGQAGMPLRITPGRRYLEDASGKPFLIHGDSAWSLIAQLRMEEVEIYLADRKARGFNTLLVSLIEHCFARNAPANAYGNPPFLMPGDYATLNESYFAHADRVLKRAAQLGFLMLVTPSYIGAGGGDEGWYQLMMENGPEKLRQYGMTIGQRYRSLGNILWVHGGDYNPPDRRLVSAIAEGIRQADNLALHTAHCAPETAALDEWAEESWLQVNTIYTYQPVHAAALAQWARPEAMPFFLVESTYENEHGVTEQRLRTQAYQALLCGAAGQIFGNNPIWHFDTPGAREAPVTWRQALDSRGTQSMTHLRKLFAQFPWWLLEPDLRKHLVTDAGGPERDHVVAASAVGGDFAILYFSSLHDIEVDLRRLRGPRVLARWYDPAIGVFSEGNGEPMRASRTVKFQPPGENDAGFTDWILVLQSYA